MGSIDALPSGLYRARWREYPGGPQKSMTFGKKRDAGEFLKTTEADLARGVYVDPTLGRGKRFATMRRRGVRCRTGGRRRATGWVR